MGKKILLVDNEDSFTLNIRDYLRQTGVQVSVLPFGQAYMRDDWKNYDALVLGPGPGNPEYMPDLLEFTRMAMVQMPVLGICLGFQAIAFALGARISRKEPRHGKTDSVKIVRRGRLFRDIPDNFTVVRYHSLVVEDLQKPLISNLMTEKGELMGFEHDSLNICGFQFHPEAHLSEYGLQLLKNWAGSF